MLWKQHEAHQNSSNSSQKIKIKFSTELTNINITKAITRSIFLEVFDAKVEKYDITYADHLLESQKIYLLLKTVKSDK